MSFDLEFRGFVEKLIDSQLTAENLARNHKFFESLKPVVADRRDAIFGYVIGVVMSKVDDFFMLINRKPTETELLEASTAIKKRVQEIKGRINETFT